MWHLDPTASNYSLGEPPKSASYEITKTEAGYRFTAQWTKTDGSENEVSFEGIPDGEEHALEAEYADALVTTRIDKSHLDTKALKDGQVVHHVVRELSEDSESMTIIQTGPDGSGGEFRNVAVYRRS